MDERCKPENESILDKLKLYREASATAEALAQEERSLLRALSERANFLELASTTDGSSYERGKVISACQAMASRLREVQIARIEATAILNDCSSNLIVVEEFAIRLRSHRSGHAAFPHPALPEVTRIKPSLASRDE